MCQVLQHNGHGAIKKTNRKSDKIQFLGSEKQRTKKTSRLNYVVPQKLSWKVAEKMQLVIFPYSVSTLFVIASLVSDFIAWIPQRVRERKRERAIYHTWCFRLVSGRSSSHEHPLIIGPSTRYSVIASCEASKPDLWANMTLSVFPSSRSTYNWLPRNRTWKFDSEYCQDSRAGENLGKRSTNYTFLFLGRAYDQCPVLLIRCFTCIVPSLRLH